MNEAERIRQILVKGLADVLAKNNIGKESLKRVAIGLTVMAVNAARGAKITLPDFLAAAEHHWHAIDALDTEKKALN